MQKTQIPESFIGNQLARLSMGNKWFGLFISKIQMVLIVLTWLVVAYGIPINLQMVIGSFLFLSALVLLWLLGVVDVRFKLSRKQWLGTYTQFDPLWDPKQGYWAKQIYAIRADLARIEHQVREHSTGIYLLGSVGAS